MMIRKEFEGIATALSVNLAPKELVIALGELFQGWNPAFDKEKFVERSTECGRTIEGSEKGRKALFTLRKGAKRPKKGLPTPFSRANP